MGAIRRFRSRRYSVVVKVVQNGVVNLQDYDNVQDGLDTNLEAMVGWVEKACSEGMHPDFILFNEFPLTGYSFGTRDEKLRVHHHRAGARDGSDR